ncbi:hypothetical protein HF888_05650 [Bermanella marisrubri]|uniref:MvaI/BcnI restriction endonuclease domain-containing protein n=2 Tax=Bermanella marisrubri TaxID=207949 RepID=Q1MY91_9GAMM|nr:hypothetical protein RED65_02328 [Oceanobacter sp. RED65] [Bermanella marisrubri]QIZ85779.1 hypothetical protein HF888_05650 [Bermanella marisrubri]
MEFSDLDFLNIESMNDVHDKLKSNDCTIALIKKLPKNNNDKNQVYFHHDTSALNSVYDMTFDEREASTSLTKRASNPGRLIPQAIFNEFYWLKRDGSREKVKECKAITYHQYPETRLSGFQTIHGNMPKAMSVEYTKSDALKPRYLVLGATDNGVAIAMMIVDPLDKFYSDFKTLKFFQGSKICKLLEIEHVSNNTEKLKNLLSQKIANQSLKGCRLLSSGETAPFTGTQVHGYTLEHALGIIPNSNHDGDILGIELKCFTRTKLSLITTEADGGLYHENFNNFMKKYGYLKGEEYRLTGLHRAYKINPKTELTLKIICFPVTKGLEEKDITRKIYDPSIPFSKQMNGMQVILEYSNGDIAASWSIEHLMNKWGAKHNEVVYVPAKVVENTIAEEKEEGFLKRVVFQDKVLWCFRSTVENLIKAIHDGIIYLDPAPKYNEMDASKNKRRTQWRLNNIYQASETLYEKTETIMLSNER